MVTDILLLLAGITLGIIFGERTWKDLLGKYKQLNAQLLAQQQEILKDWKEDQATTRRVVTEGIEALEKCSASFTEIYNAAADLPKDCPGCQRMRELAVRLGK